MADVARYTLPDGSIRKLTAEQAKAAGAKPWKGEPAPTPEPVAPPEPEIVSDVPAKKRASASAKKRTSSTARNKKRTSSTARTKTGR